VLLCIVLVVWVYGICGGLKSGKLWSMVYLHEDSMFCMFELSPLVWRVVCVRIMGTAGFVNVSFNGV